MPSDMSKIVAETSHFEGGDMTWTNRRGDAGKETVGGISRVHWPKEPLWLEVGRIKQDWWGEGPVELSALRTVGVDAPAFVASQALIREGVHAFYHARGWLYKPADPSRRVHVTDIDSQAVAGKLYDILFNGGRGMLRPCVRALQTHLGITADGICGKGTAGELNDQIGNTAPEDVDWWEMSAVAVLAQRQVEYYCRIVQKKVRAEIHDVFGDLAEELGFSSEWQAKREQDVYNATDAGNLVGWCANRAFKGLL